MLDTIVLTLDQQQFEVREPERFTPSAQGLLVPPYYRLGARGYISCFQNPTRADLDAGRYLPRLTLSKRQARAGFAVTLRVEFSAPKLVFGNNFDELRSRDFERVLGTLHRSLVEMGIRITEDTLRAARVSAIHYSKNIAFTDFTTCSMVMSELERIDLNRRLDLWRTDYRNEGHVIRYHANSFEITFYDKLKDLQQARLSEKRAVESDYGRQADLFANRNSFPKQLEVLRMEVRLGTRAKIMGVMGKIGADLEPTFAALFDASVAKDVLLIFWSEIRKQTVLLGQIQAQRPEDLLAALAESAAGTARAGRLLQQLGCLILVGSVGFRGARAALGWHCGARSWQRYKKELQSLSVACPTGFSALQEVGSALDVFSPLRMEDFQQPLTAEPAGQPARSAER
jgi:hypothetical protein